MKLSFVRGREYLLCGGSWSSRPPPLDVAQSNIYGAVYSYDNLGLRLMRKTS